MNLLKRAGLYTLRSRGRTLLLFAVLLLAATFVLSGLSAMEASENTSAKLRGTTGASFTVERNLSTGSMNSMGGGMSVIQQEFVTDAMLDEIRKVEGIKGYTAKEIGYYNLTDLSGNPYRMIYDTSLWDDTDLDYQANVIGSFFTEYDELFLSQAFQLTQGRHITDQDEDGIIISEDLAEKHGLSLGDRVLIYRPDWVTGAVNAGDKSVEAEIVGMFRILASQEDRSSMAPYNIYENYIFAPMCVTKSLIDWVDDEAEREGYEYADFYVDDPEQLESIIRSVQEIDSINWNNFNVTVNDEVYERAAGSISNTTILIRTLIIVIIVISAGVVALFLSFWLKSRLRETGILLAMGIPKTALVLQHMAETALTAVPAFGAAWFASRWSAGWITGLFESGIAAGTAAVSEWDFARVCAGGALILSVAVLLSCIPVFRYKPREILSMME